MPFWGFSPKRQRKKYRYFHIYSEVLDISKYSFKFERSTWRICKVCTTCSFNLQQLFCYLLQALSIICLLLIRSVCYFVSAMFCLLSVCLVGWQVSIISVYVSVCLSVYCPSVYLSLFVCLSVCLSFCLSVWLYLLLPARLSVYYLSIILPVAYLIRLFYDGHNLTVLREKNNRHIYVQYFIDPSFFCRS